MKSEQLLSSSRLRYLIPEISNAEILRDIYDRINVIISENQNYSKTLQKHLASGIVPAIACYEKLSHEYGKDRAYDLIRSAITKYADEYGKLLILLSKTPFFYGMTKSVMPMFLNSLYPPDGWDFRWINDSPNVIAFDAHSCFYVDIFNKYKVGELTKIFCETDDICYRKFTNARWERTKTIGRGDEICNFRFYRRKRDVMR